MTTAPVPDFSDEFSTHSRLIESARELPPSPTRATTPP